MLLFFFFGFKLFYEVYKGEEEGENDEKTEVEKELNHLHNRMFDKTIVHVEDKENSTCISRRSIIYYLIIPYISAIQ